jgi:hypothetical protein
MLAKSLYFQYVEYSEYVCGIFPTPPFLYLTKLR